MDMTEDLFNEIDAWLTNRMTPAEEAAFRERMQQNAELRQEVETQRQINQGLEAVAMKRRLATMRRGIGRQRMVRRAARSVVAVMLAGFLFTGGFDLYHYTKLMDTASQPETPERDDAVLPSGLQPALDAYYAGREDIRKYENAQRLLAPLPTDSLRLVPFYRGLTKLALKRPNDALIDLGKAQQSPNRITRQKADWYKAMAYLQANKFGKARQLLKTIQDDKEHPYHTSASDMLDKLPWWL